MIISMKSISLTKTMMYQKIPGVLKNEPNKSNISDFITLFSHSNSAHMVLKAASLHTAGDM